MMWTSRLTSARFSWSMSPSFWHLYRRYTLTHTSVTNPMVPNFKHMNKFYAQLCVAVRRALNLPQITHMCLKLEWWPPSYCQNCWFWAKAVSSSLWLKLPYTASENLTAWQDVWSTDAAVPKLCFIISKQLALWTSSKFTISTWCFCSLVDIVPGLLAGIERCVGANAVQIWGEWHTAWTKTQSKEKTHQYWGESNAHHPCNPLLHSNVITVVLSIPEISKSHLDQDSSLRLWWGWSIDFYCIAACPYAEFNQFFCSLIVRAYASGVEKRPSMRMAHCVRPWDLHQTSGFLIQKQTIKISSVGWFWWFWRWDRGHVRGYSYSKPLCCYIHSFCTNQVHQLGMLFLFDINQVMPKNCSLWAILWLCSCINHTSCHVLFTPFITRGE